MNVPDYIRPLIAHRKTAEGVYPDGRFVGTCFFIDTIGTVLTCAHIIENMDEDEELFSYDQENNKFVRVRILYKHKTADFAICQLYNTKSKHFTLRHGVVSLGRDIISYGHLSNGVSNGAIDVDFRVMKGHVSRVNSNASRGLRGNKIIEVSFPSLSGFSGAPVFDGENLDLVGMLFGNIESSVEVFSHKEVNENGEEIFSENVHRIIEYGVGHSTDSIVQYLEESKSKINV